MAPFSNTKFRDTLMTALVGMASGGIVWAANSLVSGNTATAIVKEQVAVEARRGDNLEARLSSLEQSTARILTKLDYIERGQGDIMKELKNPGQGEELP